MMAPKSIGGFGVKLSFPREMYNQDAHTKIKKTISLVHY